MGRQTSLPPHPLSHKADFPELKTISTNELLKSISSLRITGVAVYKVIVSVRWATRFLFHVNGGLNRAFTSLIALRQSQGKLTFFALGDLSYGIVDVDNFV